MYVWHDQFLYYVQVSRIQLESGVTQKEQVCDIDSSRATDHEMC